MLPHSINKERLSDSEFVPPMFVRLDSSICKKQHCKLNIFYAGGLLGLYNQPAVTMARPLANGKLLHAGFYHLLILQC